MINERTVTGHDSSDGVISEHSDFLDSAARIEAANDMSIRAGRDFSNQGSVLQSGRDTTIQAGRDLSFGSVEQANSNANLSARNNSRSVTQNGSSVTAGRDLSAIAGRDLTAIASQMDAKRDVAMSAVGDLTMASAADEQHSALNLKKVKAQEDHVSQVGTSVKAGGDVSLSAGKDLAMIASRVSAGDEAYLVAGGKLGLLAAEDSDYSLYDMKKKGSFGSKKTQRDEVTQVTNIGSEITSGGDLTLKSGSDQMYQAAKLESGQDITLDSGGGITFEAAKDLHQESHEKSNNNAFWVSAKGKGNTDETVRQTQMVAEGNIAIKAVEGLKIDVLQVNQQTVSQSIDAMVKADPQLAWLKDAEKRGDVDWRQVKEIHDSFKYSNSGLGPASQIIIAIVMSAVLGPMAATAAGGSVTGAAVGAVASGAATNATVSVINNRGNLGAVLKDVTSSDAMKGYVISGVTAGLTVGVFDGWTGTQTNPSTGAVITSPDLNTWTGVGQFAANQVLQNGTSTLLSKALGQGGDFGDALKGALFNTLAAASFNAVGDYTQGKLTDGYPPKILVHAMVGGLLSQATGGDFKTGALAAGINEAAVVHLDSLVRGDKNLLSMSSQIVGVLAAASQKDADAKSIEKGGWVAKNATQYNYLLHHEVEKMLEEVDSKQTDAEKNEVRERYAQLDEARNQELASVCKAAPNACDALSSQLIEDEPKLRELAKSLAAQGHLKEAATIAALTINNNVTAGLTIATELAAQRDGEGSSFWTGAAGTLLGAAIGGMRPGGDGAKGTIPENMSPTGAGRSGAFNEAKRQSGIPTSQQPSRTLPNVDKRGNPQPGKIYEFEVPASGGGLKTVRIRDDAGGHDFGSGNSQNRGSHFNDETGNHYDY
ncbi:filamentous hemagglutinin [Pseudomonas palleroniana]|uniref:Filamentous hemagglutinin n=2 Tax=Pseudomonas TaxID=286 RepID=A0A2L1J558_9PSED|nr:filamentous hemagglutinin [Pseudomonas palleroniana]